MTRRDYVLLSATLRGAQPPRDEAAERAGWRYTCRCVADSLHEANPNGFDRARFLVDCGVA